MGKMRALDYFFYPKSIAVIGASRDPEKVGHAILHNLVNGKFKGELFPINPHAEYVLNLKCHKSIKQVKADLDLAVIAVHAEEVPEELEQCGAKGIEAVIIVSAGFGEIGNRKLAEKIAKIKRKYKKMRVIGPNCLGILNTENGVDTLFLPEYRLKRPEKGEISFISQSGALGSAVLDWASMQEIGISKFVSYGNAMDIDESDLLEYLAQDKNTNVIVMYIEGVKNGTKFMQAARKFAGKKPIIVLKGGITAEGEKAVKSHTGSLAGSAEVYNAVFRQAGIIKAENLLELFDFARVLSKVARPKGNRVQIITDGGGYGVITADAVIKEGLQLAEMEEKNKKFLRKIFPSYAVLGNPLDLTGDATMERYKAAAEAAMRDKNVDIVILILLYQVPTLNSDVIDIVAELSNRKAKPLVVISVGGAYSEVHKRALEREGVVNFSYPENAIKALKALIDYYKKK